MTQKIHQSKLLPSDNKFHKGNGTDGKHYWLTPPEKIVTEWRNAFNFPFDFDPCPNHKNPLPGMPILPIDWDGLTAEKWGKWNYINPPFGSIMHQGPEDSKPKKKGNTAWVRKTIADHRINAANEFFVFPIDK